MPSYPPFFSPACPPPRTRAHSQGVSLPRRRQQSIESSSLTRTSALLECVRECARVHARVEPLYIINSFEHVVQVERKRSRSWIMQSQTHRTVHTIPRYLAGSIETLPRFNAVCVFLLFFRCEFFAYQCNHSFYFGVLKVHNLNLPALRMNLPFAALTLRRIQLRFHSVLL